MLLGQPVVPGWRGEVVVEERLDGSRWARVDGILHPVVPRLHEAAQSGGVASVVGG
jgi:hypothetical protein